MIEALADPDGDASKATALYIGEIFSGTVVCSLIEGLQYAAKCNYQEAADNLSKISSEAIKALKGHDKDLRNAVVVRMARMLSDAVPALIEGLKDPDKDVRLAGACGIEKYSSDAAVPALIEALKDPDKDVRKAVADALGKVSSKAAVPALSRL